MAGIQTLNRSGGRFYVDPVSNRKAPSVTSIVAMLPKPFLTAWAAKLTAENAVDHLGSIVDLALTDRSGAVDYMKRAPHRSTKDAADVGTQVHDLFEQVARGQDLGRVHPDMLRYVEHIEDFHERYEPDYLHIEDAVWSDKHDYAGSFDAVCRIDGELVIVDVKTTRSGVHEDAALQLAAYTFADRVIDQVGESKPMPAIEAAAVLHLRPEGWQLVPVRVDEEVLSFFLHLRHIFDWNTEVAKTVIGPPVYESTPSTGSQRRKAKH
ncbi:PD-(D/E)XK nuclease family protein [Saccharopolyspora taberi]|uniref:PD-(D/E)XK endonuclease-like domain-containing protein n=1 Tax=Saccharopolyspora taberi TaxID=60895 RepID=A0ABN3VK29_9PSEU